ncbi:Eukaryotic translation initiation factor 3 subunit J [Physocladia obscura]|uniref:Eukaryotic translation initiation factor 3 subunit J n=1 Tax=Physocladia obscura TaxID=109957 RepID=A0AAD5T3P1_9FUNG|nr:Eukaryotic translation initiation factor 3 subunit J [Physocladia obscura]
MSDDDWDNDEELEIPSVKIVIPPITAASSSWDDEDATPAENNVQDDWDAEDADDEPSTTAKSTTTSSSAKVAAPKKKKNLKEAIATRKAEEERKLQEAIEVANRKKLEEELETPEERKKREERNIREADLQNARDLFAGVSSDASPPKAASFLETMAPKSKEEFAEYEKKLVENISKHEKATNYAMFVENLTRDLSVSLSVDEVKRISSALTVLANEKQKALKPAVGGKKKVGAAKAIPVVAKSNAGIDMTNYGAEDYNDYDDFM